MLHQRIQEGTEGPFYQPSILRPQKCSFITWILNSKDLIGLKNDKS